MGDAVNWIQRLETLLLSPREPAWLTLTKCRKMLLRYPRKAVWLALVAEIHERVLENCGAEARLPCEWALDVTRRRALDLAEEDECYAAAFATEDAASASDPHAAIAVATGAGDLAYDNYGTYAACYDAGTAAAATRVRNHASISDDEFSANCAAAAAYDAYHASCFTEDGPTGRAGAAARRRLVDSLRDAPMTWDVVTTARGDVVSAESVWLREGDFGGRWVARAALTSEELVGLDMAMEHP